MSAVCLKIHIFTGWHWGDSAEGVGLRISKDTKKQVCIIQVLDPTRRTITIYTGKYVVFKYSLQPFKTQELINNYCTLPLTKLLALNSSKYLKFKFVNSFLLPRFFFLPTETETWCSAVQKNNKYTDDFSYPGN